MNTIREADFWGIYRELHQKNGVKTTTPDPKGLFDGLEAKRQLVSLLENGGHIKQREAEHLRQDIDEALHELEAILRTCSHGEVSS